MSRVSCYVDTLLGDDDFLDEFKDLPGVDCFLGTVRATIKSL